MSDTVKCFYLLHFSYGFLSNTDCSKSVSQIDCSGVPSIRSCQMLTVTAKSSDFKCSYEYQKYVEYLGNIYTSVLIWATFDVAICRRKRPRLQSLTHFTKNKSNWIYSMEFTSEYTGIGLGSKRHKIKMYVAKLANVRLQSYPSGSKPQQL